MSNKKPISAKTTQALKNLASMVVKKSADNSSNKIQSDKKVIGNIYEIKDDKYYVCLNGNWGKEYESGSYINKSGRRLSVGDKVIVEQVNGSSSNAYISQKISDNNDNHINGDVDGDNIDDDSIGSNHLQTGIVQSKHIANQTSICPMSEETILSDLYTITVNDNTINRVFYGMCIKVTPDTTSSNPVVLNIVLNGKSYNYKVNTTFTANQQVSLVCDENSSNENVLEFNTGSSQPIYITGNATKQTNISYYNIRCDDINIDEYDNCRYFGIEPNINSSNNVSLGINNLGVAELHDYSNDNISDLVAHIPLNIRYGVVNANFIL